MKVKTKQVTILMAVSCMMLQLSACSSHHVQENSTASNTENFQEINADSFADLFGNRAVAQATLVGEGAVNVVKEIAAMVSGKETEELMTATRSAEKSLKFTGKASIEDLKSGKVSPALAEKIRENLEANTGGFLHTDGFKSQEAKSAAVEANANKIDASTGHLKTALKDPKLTKTIPAEALETMTEIENGLWSQEAPELVKPIAHDYAVAWNGHLKILVKKSCIKLDHEALLNVKKLTGREAGAVQAIAKNEAKTSPSFYENTTRCAFKATENWAARDLGMGSAQANYKEIRDRVLRLCRDCGENDKKVCQLFEDNADAEPTIPTTCDIAA